MPYFYIIYDKESGNNKAKKLIVIKKSKDMISGISKLGKLATAKNVAEIDGNEHNVCLECDKVISKTVKFCDGCGDKVTVVKP